VKLQLHTAALALVAFSASGVLAQEKCKRSGEVPAASTTYTQQHVLDVGDIPGHQIRIYEIHRTYPNAQPNCEGVKETESWTRAFSDYIDRNGRTWGYTVAMLENGDKIFSEFSGTSQTFTDSNGKKESTFTGITRYTGGTGRYAGIRGFSRETSKFDPDKKLNQLSYASEYWIEK
jgi:hypothetical protein